MPQQTEMFAGLPPLREFSSNGKKLIGPKGGKHYTAPKGYAARPGSGPVGERCKTCRHYTYGGGGARAHPKCELMKHAWTHGPGSDIRASSPACERWEQAVKKSAILSPCGKYRYLLTRQWHEGDGKMAVFILLNPSTANAEIDDATVRKCMAFARHWGKSGLRILNLFAFRATDPADLACAENPVGPANWETLVEYIQNGIAGGDVLVAGWGANVWRPKLLEDSSATIGRVTKWAHNKLYCLGLTKDGCPKHPLYVPLSTALKECF